MEKCKGHCHARGRVELYTLHGSVTLKSWLKVNIDIVLEELKYSIEPHGVSALKQVCLFRFHFYNPQVIHLKFLFLIFEPG